MTPHDIKDIAELIGFGLIAWRIIASVNRLTTVLRDYPPHRHEPGGVVVYPYDYQPAPTGRLNGGNK